LGEIDYVDGTWAPRIPTPERLVLQRFHKPEMVASRVFYHPLLLEKALHDLTMSIVPSPSHANNSERIA